MGGPNEETTWSENYPESFIKSKSSLKYLAALKLGLSGPTILPLLSP